MNPSDLDQALTAVLETASKHELKSFILVSAQPDTENKGRFSITTRFQAINPAIAIQAAAQTLKEAIGFELKNHPEYSISFKLIFERLNFDLDKAMERAMKGVKEFRK